MRAVEKSTRVKKKLKLNREPPLSATWTPNISIWFAPETRTTVLPNRARFAPEARTTICITTILRNRGICTSRRHRRGVARCCAPVEVWNILLPIFNLPNTTKKHPAECPSALLRVYLPATFAGHLSVSSIVSSGLRRPYNRLLLTLRIPNP